MARFGYAFGGEEHREFHLGFAELRGLQEECEAGPPLVLRRLMSNEWTVDDVSCTIRFGLIGAGMSHVEAMQVVKRYVHDLPAWNENAMIAIGILSFALYGPEGEEQPEKSTGEGETNPNLSPASDGALEP